MENPAQQPELEDRGYAGPATPAVQQKWLDVAWRQLRRDLRRHHVDLEAALTDGTLDTDDVVDVVVAATLRVLRNPEGVESESAGIDDYREAIKHRDASEDVYFTAAELRSLLPAEAHTPGSGWSGSVQYQ